MNIVNKSILAACITTFMIIGYNESHASIAKKGDTDYLSGNCIKNEVVENVHVNNSYSLTFKVGGKWFTYDQKITYADAQAAHKMLVASLLTGSTISANYGTYSCSYEKVSAVLLNEN